MGNRIKTLYESVGRGFESLPSHQEKPEHVCVLVFLFVSTMEGARTGRRRAAPQAISPVQQRRPQPAAETGRSCWGRVLIFQSPAKGLRKNQQTQPVQAPAVRFRQGSQRLGMSTGMTAVLWWTVQDENRNEQRQGITMIVVSCLLLFLIEYGILGSVQQICIWRIESCGMN